MGIGTSKGAFYRDEGHYAASMWDNAYDDNIVSPQELIDRENYPVAIEASVKKDEIAAFLESGIEDRRNENYKPDQPFTDGRYDFDPASVVPESKLSKELGSSSLNPRDPMPPLIRRLPSAPRAMGDEPDPLESNPRTKVITGYKIIDRHTGQQIGKDYKPDVSQRRRARTRVDKLDNEYGAYRYRLDPIWSDPE